MHNTLHAYTHYTHNRKKTNKLNKFNFCVSVVAATYYIVQYVNSAVKSMCSITATSYDIGRHRPMSYDVVRSVNTA